MSESQFAYSGLTLDELRSLAASPQVGTLHAMPQSFRALADRVGEVADLLTHTQLNMHHWWKGPAAEQAAAMLGQAAAEAREFHDTAMGAATAVGHCAQIVSEQQHQMMNVPEVAEPGVTDVVPRPTTPFEALEAARRDAAYQAAHEQAVQVVNGIAAQYVETHSQLSNMGFAFFGENFTPRNEPAAASSQPEVSLSSNSRPATFEPIRPLRSNRQEYTAAASSSLTAAGLSKSKATSYERTYRPSKMTSASAFGADKATNTTPPLTGHLDRQEKSEFIADPDYPEPSAASDPLTTISGELLGIDSKYGPEDVLPPTNLSSGFSSQITNERALSGSPYRLRGNLPETVRSGNVEAGDIGITKAGITSTNQPPTDPQQLLYRSEPGTASNDNAAMIPPYPGMGSVHRSREERSRRPTYLTERKSTWLPDTIAAPPDGVLSPEWFEQR